MTITTPENSPNIDGTHMSSSKEINILNTNITVEDNCISVGDTNKQIVISNITCESGHGISIGYLGK
uniref:Polygalacturonase-like n=1 Tax=Cucumis melo TaxID=3656 RepID=A0A9I9CX68_CUCME